MGTNFDFASVQRSTEGFLGRLSALGRTALRAGPAVGVVLALAGPATIGTAIAQQPGVSPTSPELIMLRKVSLLEEGAQAGQANFEQTLMVVEPDIRAASGAKASKDMREAAKTDLASLDASRFASVSALQDLTQLVAEARKAGAAADKVEAIRAKVQKIVNGQNARLKALGATLPSRS